MVSALTAFISTLAAAALGLAPRSVLVCGPKQSAAGGLTVSEYVASSLREAEVVRWEKPSTPVPAVASSCEAAVVCVDGWEEVSLEEALDAALAVARPDWVVVVAGDEEDKTPGGWFGRESSSSSASEVAAKASSAGASRVALVRHGELFGGDAAPAFVDGLKMVPTLSDEYGRRGARLSPARGAGSRASTRRATVGRVVAETLAGLAPGRADLDVRSAAGPEPNEAEWRTAVAEALAASDPRCAFRTSLGRRNCDPKRLGDWLLDTWGPLALRKLKAAYATKGARPVAFDKTNDALASLRWEDFDGAQVSTVASLVFQVDEDLFLVSRRGGSDQALPGEVELMDSLADAFIQAFPVLQEEEFEEEMPSAEDTTVDVEEEVADEVEEPRPKKPAPKTKVRRSSVRARTSSVSPKLPPSPPATTE